MLAMCGDLRWGLQERLSKTRTPIYSLLTNLTCFLPYFLGLEVEGPHLRSKFGKIFPS
jgi:hypothetical protein